MSYQLSGDFSIVLSIRFDGILMTNHISVLPTEQWILATRLQTGYYIHTENKEKVREKKLRSKRERERERGLFFLK